LKHLIFTITLVAFVMTFQATGFSQFTQEQQTSTTPVDALQLLKDGNKRFVTSGSEIRNSMVEVKNSSTGQYPYAVLLSCMDSRVAPETLFDQGIGDIFINRVAGNISNDDMLGGMEYGCAVVGSKLILVLGHTDCGAVKGAIDGAELGNLTGLLNKIDPAVSATKYDGDRTSKDKGFVELVTEENVRLTVEQIRNNSPVLKGMEDEGKIKIVGGMYNVSTGEVTFYE
jgi:carbonic anhydrase